MVETILAILLVFWLVGVVAHIGGQLIHILLIVFFVVLLYRLVGLVGRNQQD
jgi:hypothetical protein